MDGLAERVRSGATLSSAERDFLADYLIGSVRLDKAALRLERKIAGHLAMASWVLHRKIVNGGPLEAAIAEAEEVFGYSRRTIQTALNNHDTLPGAETRKTMLELFKDYVTEQRK